MEVDLDVSPEREDEHDDRRSPSPGGKRKAREDGGEAEDGPSSSSKCLRRDGILDLEMTEEEEMKLAEQGEVCLTVPNHLIPKYSIYFSFLTSCVHKPECNDIG